MIYLLRHFAITLILIVFVTSCGTPPEVSTLPSDKLFELGMEAYNNKKYIKSLNYFQTIVYNYPGETVVDTAQYYVGLSYFGNEEYVLAEREFNRLQLNYPSSDFNVPSQFLRAVCYYEQTPKHYGLDQKQLLTAIRHFEDFIIDHPESEMIGDAQEYVLKAKTRLARKSYETAMVYWHINLLNPAKTYLQKVIDEYTSTEYAGPATFQLAELYYKKKNYEESIKRYDNFLSVFPESELAEKATERLEESEFLVGKIAFEKEEFAKAKRLFESFVSEYPESGRAKKANKYLNKISELPTQSIEGEQANKDTEG